MISKIKDVMKKAKPYILIAGATIGLPLITELSGCSQTFAQRSNELQRQELVYMLDRPEYTDQREDIQRNIEYIDQYKDVRNQSARIGADAFALLFGFSGVSGVVVAKRKMDEFFS